MDYYTADRKDWALKRAKALASVLGCNDTQNTFLTAEQIQCLRSVSVEKIMRAAEHPKVTAAAPKLPIDTPFLPIFGDEYIPIAPRIAWKTKAFKNDTELLIGTVYNETPMGSMIPRFIPPSAATEYQCRTTVPSQLLTMQECDELVRIYFLGIDEQRERPRAVETAMQLQTDVTFLCPSKAFAESFSEVNKVGQYFFLYKSKHDKIDC
ncbi:acetylcholinesterase 3-like protein, partial [Leptotrombidium deliense]